MREQWKQAARRVARRRLARGTFTLTKDRVLTTNPDGLMLYLDAADTSLTPVILTRRNYEPGTTRLMRRLVHHGARVVEVGANIGWHVLTAAERVGPTGRVTAFEPNPSVFDLLHTNVFVNGLWDRCTLHQCAVGRTSGEMVLRVPGTYSGGANLRERDAGALKWMHQDDSEAIVKVVTLDDVLSDNYRCDLMKMDVEGFEMEVLAGAEKFFAANPALKMIVEFSPGHHGDDFVSWFADRGMRFHEIDRFGRTHAIADPMRLVGGTAIDLFITR